MSLKRDSASCRSFTRVQMKRVTTLTASSDPAGSDRDRAIRRCLASCRGTWISLLGDFRPIFLVDQVALNRRSWRSSYGITLLIIIPSLLLSDMQLRSEIFGSTNHSAHCHILCFDPGLHLPQPIVLWSKSKEVYERYWFMSVIDCMKHTAF